MDREPQDPDSEDDISLADLFSWLQFGGWAALLLIPMLYFVNGQAVSHDQFIVRCGLVVMAIILGPGFTVVRKVRNTQTDSR